jgi:lactoylglutathione lyase
MTMLSIKSKVGRPSFSSFPFANTNVFKYADQSNELAAELSATKSLYVSTFGLPIVYEDDDCAVFQFKNALIDLLEESAGVEQLDPEPVAPKAEGPRFVFTIDVDDVDQTCAELTSRGVKLLNSPMDRPWGIRTAGFKGPAGYIWAISKDLRTLRSYPSYRDC